MVDYARWYPCSARASCRFMGFTVDGLTPAFRTAGEHIRFVGLEATDR
ncbi:hypothetical protein SLA_0072 [Streptomyces laurentii]|uniref:Uncharacterized protein n=1 Tax=Streptomyces laurentii TaxID=39478 RepID=A0A170RU63_STRLU|nr:hypothetical protein SLA_0072 [Streptomyces laurentii]